MSASEASRNGEQCFRAASEASRNGEQCFRTASEAKSEGQRKSPKSIHRGQLGHGFVVTTSGSSRRQLVGWQIRSFLFAAGASRSSRIEFGVQADSKKPSKTDAPEIHKVHAASQVRINLFMKNLERAAARNSSNLATFE